MQQHVWEIHPKKDIREILHCYNDPELFGTVEADTLEKAKRRSTAASGQNFKRIGNYDYGNCPWVKYNSTIYYRVQTERHVKREDRKMLVLYFSTQ